MNNPLTAAATGLHIGLLLCCLCGCQEPAPTPADDACVEDATPAVAAEQSVVVVESQSDEWERFAASYPYLAADWQRYVATSDKQNADYEKEFAEWKAGTEQRKLDWADFKRRLTTLEKPKDAQNCKDGICTLPQSPVEKHATAASNLIDDAEQRSIDDGEKLIIVLTKDGCSRSSTFKSHVIGDSFFRAIDGNTNFLEVNTSRHPEAAGRFDIKPGTLLPIALLWNPATKTFHEIPANPFGSQGDFLSELDLPQDAAAPRKRLLNLFRKD